MQIPGLMACKYLVSPQASTLSAKVARREATCCPQSTSVTNEPFIRHTYQVPSIYGTRARALTHKHAWTYTMGNENGVLHI